MKEQNQWRGGARSNLFKVKDKKAFLAWAEGLDLDVLERKEMVSISTPYGWPSQLVTLPDGKMTPINLYEDIQNHLVEGEVAVLVEAGDDNAPWGSAVALNSIGQHVSICLDEIYLKARHLGKTVRQIPESRFKR